MATIQQGTIFPTDLVTDMFSLVKGRSSIAKMVSSKPIPFNGETEFTFSMDNEISIVGEGENKPAGDSTLGSVVVRPIKVIYQSRVSDEFINASEKARVGYLKEFADGFSKKIAKGLDLMILHGVNPATGSASQIIGTNHLDSKIKTGKKVDYDSTTDRADQKVNAAIQLVDDANGVIFGNTIRNDVSEITENGVTKYPDFAWGATPAKLGTMTLDTNSTVEANNSTSRAYVGNWDALKWGYAKEIPLEVIEYGDPDGQGDLKRKNEVLLRSEAFVGWGIMDPDSFSMVKVGE